jgi:p-hydroxybenzoic acid efflux pump subunit AaeA
LCLAKKPFVGSALLGTDQVLTGHVESIAHGITDRDNPTDVRLLANVNPSFNWVRLAQRIPVRVRLDDSPQNAALVAGMTCSVIVKQKSQLNI